MLNQRYKTHVIRVLCRYYEKENNKAVGWG